MVEKLLLLTYATNALQKMLIDLYFIGFNYKILGIFMLSKTHVKEHNYFIAFKYK